MLPRSLSNKNRPLSPTNFKKRIFNQQSIEKFKLFCSNDSNWSNIYRYNNTNCDNPNLVYEEFLHVFNYGFNTCFSKKAIRKNKSTPRKEWMTIGLAKSCEIKSTLYKIHKQTKTNESKINSHRTVIS